MELGISRSSCHYKYHQWLKRIWGLNIEGEPKSLCTYCQLIFGFSFFTVGFSFIMLIGWAELKFFRLCYKQLSKSKRGEKVIDWLDRKIDFGGFLETRSNKLEFSPAISSVTMFSMVGLAVMGIFCVGIVLSGGGMGLWLFAMKIPWLLYHTGTGFLYAGWAIFIAVAGFARATYYIGFGTYWLFKTVSLWFVYNIGIILTYIGMTLVAILAATVLVYVIMKFFQSKSGKKFVEYLIFKFNGFQQARQDAKVRKDSEKVPTPVSVHGPTILQMIRKCLSVVWKWLKAVFGFIFGRVEKIESPFARERVIRIMGVFPLIWNFLVSIKDGVCPFVTFVDEDQIQHGNDVDN